MSYASPQDFIDRMDVRRLGDLGLDTGTRATPTQLLTNTRLQDSLDDASGMIDATLLRAGRYQPKDLTTLTGTTSFGNKLLIRITVNIAYGLLLEARGYSEEEQGSMAPGFTKALAYLDRLENGEWIFGIPPVIDAGGSAQNVNAYLSSKVVLLTQATRRYFGGLNYNPGLPPNNPNVN